MRVYNLYRSAVKRDVLDLLYLGKDLEMITFLNTDPRLNISLSSPQDQPVYFDAIFFDEEKEVLNARRISSSLAIPALFLANKKPSKKETGYMFKNRMNHVAAIMCSSPELSLDWYEPNPLVFDKFNLERAYECLINSLRVAKTVFLRNTPMMSNTDAQRVN